MRDLNVKKGDIYIVGIVCLVTLVGFVITRTKEPGQIVKITYKGQETEYSIADEQEIVIEDHHEVTNIVKISDKCVVMTEANCPDQICVKHKAIQKDGEMIVCLPNQVFVEVVGGKEKEIDN